MVSVKMMPRLNCRYSFLNLDRISSTVIYITTIIRFSFKQYNSYICATEYQYTFLYTNLLQQTNCFSIAILSRPTVTLLDIIYVLTSSILITLKSQQKGKPENSQFLLNTLLYGKVAGYLHEETVRKK